MNWLKTLLQAVLGGRKAPARDDRETFFLGAQFDWGRPVTDDEVAAALRAVPAHFAGLSTLNAQISTEFKVSSAAVNQTGQAYNGYSSNVDIRKSQSLGTTLGNTTSGGADQVFSFQQGITANSIATFDVTALVDLVGRSAPGVVRVKAVQVRLLSAADDSTLSPAPTAASACTVTNNPPTTATMDVPCPLHFGNGGSGLTLTITTAAGALTAAAIGAAGSGYPKSSFFLVAPQQAGGSGACVGVITNASGVPTSVVFLAGAAGAGYTNATVPSVVLQSRYILTGGVDCYFDPNANGICAVSSTSKKFAVVNLDAANAITVEIDLICASS